CGKHPITVTLGEFRDVRVHCGQHCRRHLLYRVAHQRFTPNDVEILPIETEVVPHKLGEHLDLGVVLRTDDRVHIETKTICVFLLQRVQRLDTVECLLPVSGNTPNAIVRFAVTVESNVQIEIDRRVVSEGAVNNVINTLFDNSVGGNDDAVDAVVCNEQVDDG